MTRRPTLAEGEIFHLALQAAAQHCGLRARYCGALAGSYTVGVQPAYQPAMWAIEERAPAPSSKGLAHEPTPLFVFALGAPTGTKLAFELKLARATLAVGVTRVSGGGSFRSALQRAGVDDKLFLDVLGRKSAHPNA
jgi:hypothetical protein